MSGHPPPLPNTKPPYLLRPLVLLGVEQQNGPCIVRSSQQVNPGLRPVQGAGEGRGSESRPAGGAHCPEPPEGQPGIGACEGGRHWCLQWACEGGRGEVG